MLFDLKLLCEKYKFIPNGIIHCGAHLAEEKIVYNSLFINNVVWIEANKKLVDSMKMMDSLKNDIIVNELLWNNSDEELFFYITNNMQSSSILELDKHRLYHPEVEVEKKVKIKTKKLDDIIDEYKININNYNFLNLDLQGVELKVIKGFNKNIKHIDYIYTEINTGEVYKNCDKLYEMDEYLQEKNFQRVELNIGTAEWGDAFYIKKKK
jgi:FkbM family methyltransferase